MSEQEKDLFQIKTLILRFVEKYPSRELLEARGLRGPRAHLLLKSRIMLEACKLAMEVGSELGASSDAHLARYKGQDGN